MDKLVLRDAINALTTGQTLNINFVGPRAHLSGDYTVTKVRNGRGKGGSRLVEMLSLSGNGQSITTGTPDSATIMNMTVNGTVYGVPTMSDLPQAFDRDVAHAAELKSSFRQFIGVEPGTMRVSVDSSVPEFQGEFRVMEAKLFAGRTGQIRLSLESVSTGKTVDIWTLRHSGIVRSVTLLSA